MGEDMGKQYRVLILGYGEMGHAMEFLLQANHQLSIWEKYPQPGFQSVDLKTTVPEADVILFCLPVNPHREVAETIQPWLKPGTICVSIAKGLDEAGQTAAQIFHDVLEPQSFALLYGPMISEDIRAGRYAFAQLGIHHSRVSSVVQDLFSGTKLYMVPSSDITGISWAVILKNVYAMVFGMADELLLGDNMRGYLAVAALHELDQIVGLMGGSTGSSFHLAGLGDLVTTATSEDSHHHELGRRLARGESDNISGEGVHTLQMVIKHRLFNPDEYPLFSLIASLVASPGQFEARLASYLGKVFNPSVP
jgi:glycerol-3-phosphate dehydrogenase (NAD(P)+)